MKKVSIVVPVYNAEKYLEKSIGSLINQTLEDIEIIAVNDGSKDNSLDILREYERKYPEKIKVFSKDNGGQATARNLALKYVSGEYIACIDADDEVDTTMFEKMYNRAKEGDYDCVACDSYEIKGEKKTYVTYKDYEDLNRLFVDSWVSPCVKIIKKEIYEEGKIFFPEGYIYEDTAWWAFVIPYIKKFSVVHEPLFYRNVNENSTMTSKQEERTSHIFPVMNAVIDFYKERGLLEKYFSEVEYFYLRILLMGSLERISKINNRKLRKQYTKQSLKEVKEHFPAFKKNKYLSGGRKTYIKLINCLTIRFYVWLLRINSK